MPIESTFIDPTGAFRDDPVSAVYDGTLRYVDESALGEATVDSLRDPTELDLYARIR